MKKLIKEPFAMKKQLLVLLCVLIICTLFTGCNKKNDKNTESTNSDITSSENNSNDYSEDDFLTFPEEWFDGSIVLPPEVF